MTERFRSAANTLLKRRLNNLVRIDDKVEIDRNYITCAEYQLFIDDMRQEGKNRQPDHWTSERFPPGYAKKPVTGVRASDAEEFCQWLTQKESVSGFHYRLPSLAETQQTLATTEDIGCWCKDDNNSIISGIKNQQWQTWQEQLSHYLVVISPFNLNLNLNRDLYLDLYLDLYRNLYLDLYLDRDLNRDLDPYRDLYQDLNRNLNRNLNQNLNLNQDQDLNLYRNFNLNQYLYRNLNQDLNRNLYRNFNLNLYRDQEIKENRASNLLLIYFPLIFVIFFYQVLVIIYRKIAQNRNVQIPINRSSQECEEISKEYEQKRDTIYQLYVYLVLIDQRQKGNMPAWEGIRIVREREEID